MTIEEAITSLRKQGIEVTEDLLTWCQYMVDQATAIAVQLEADLYQQIRASVTAPANPKALKAAEEAWRNQARQQAQTLATRMSESQLETIGQTVAKGLQDGIGPKEIARRLDMVKELDPQRAKTLLNLEDQMRAAGMSEDTIRAAVDRKKAQLLRERREAIARTEARYATSEAGLENAKARGARFKTWVSTQDGRVSDECAANEAQGPIPIEDSFSSGHQAPPSHVNCRCSLAYHTSDEQVDRARERAERRAAKTEKAKSSE